ncbi:MAG: phage minor capsid protein [Oscillospiraceae bacterium]|nr:phage minor capsid protein [Oscillospiraceae bacterium]
MQERELKRLIDIYLQAETDIINEIGRLHSRGLADYHAEAALDRIQGILRKLENDCWTYVPRMIESQFYVHHPEARKALEEPESPAKHLRAYQNARILTGEQADIVQLLTANLMAQVTEANVTAAANLREVLIGRLDGDIFRETGLAQAASMQASGRGVYKSLPDFAAALRREGVTAFVDRAGRKWSLHTYGSMVLRTTSRQAEVLSVLTEDPAHDLYKISAHGTTCRICAPLEGRVYSKSGRDPDFPPLSAAFGKVDPSGPDDLSNTWLNLHPNCLHQIIRWTPMGRSEEEIRKIKDFSSFRKNPPKKDPRTEKQAKAYRQKEANRAKWLADYRQWERCRAALGDGVPKTFETFRKHKAAGDEKFKLWGLDYRRQNDLLRHPEKALPGAASATAAEAKFTRYFFNPENENGFKKGLAFTSRLGYHINNWKQMQEEIISAARKYPAVSRGKTAYGESYSQDVILYGLKGKPANVQIGWIVHPDGTAHMVTAHMEKI